VSPKYEILVVTAAPRIYASHISLGTQHFSEKMVMAMKVIVMTMKIVMIMAKFSLLQV
jgi:hypothetical protein